MADDPAVHQVSVKKAGGYNLISVQEFLAIPSGERTKLILEKMVQFLDQGGAIIPMLDAIRSINKTRTNGA